MPESARGPAGVVGCLLYVAALGWLIFLSPFEFFPPPSGVDGIEHAEYAAVQAGVPGGIRAGAWQPITLPDDWNVTHDEHEIWYRAALDMESAPESTQAWGVYIPFVVFNAAVFINGAWVGQGGPFEPSLSRHWNEPLLFEFSPALLRSGRNELHIRVKTTVPRKGYLDRLYVAPLESLRGAYEWKYLARVEFTRWIAMALLFSAAIVGGLWLSRPQESAYGYFCLSAISFAIHLLNSFLRDAPLPVRVWEALIYISLGWAVVAMVCYNHRYVGQRFPLVERALGVFAALGLVILLIPDISVVARVSVQVWHLGLLLIGSYAISFVLYAFWREPLLDTFLMLIAGLTILICGLHDVLVLNYLWDKSDSMIIQYGIFTAVIVFLWFAVKRFASSLNIQEMLNRTLEQRIRAREAELQRQFEHINRLEGERLLSDERERIMRDMHDGIGGQLVSLVAGLRRADEGSSDALRQKAETILEDLRMVISSLDPNLKDLQTLLGMIRQRLNTQLAETGVVLEWKVTKLPATPRLNPGELLHIMRIIQEAVTNVIKHTDSDKVTLDTASSSDCSVVLTIRGNGEERARQSGGSGHGLESMHRRAEALGASMSLDNCAVTLCLPVETSVPSHESRAAEERTSGSK